MIVYTERKIHNKDLRNVDHLIQSVLLLKPILLPAFTISQTVVVFVVILLGMFLNLFKSEQIYQGF